jgi:hypothetical protein
VYYRRLQIHGALQPTISCLRHHVLLWLHVQNLWPTSVKRTTEECAKHRASTLNSERPQQREEDNGTPGAAASHRPRLRKLVLPHTSYVQLILLQAPSAFA